MHGRPGLYGLTVHKSPGSGCPNHFPEACSRRMLSDWEIKARAHRCSRTDEPFTDGAPIYTLLFRDKTRFVREDISEAAWRQLKGAIKPFSFWKSYYRTPPARPPETVPRESAEGLLRRLLDEDNAGSVNARYVLAIMLERKRILRQVDVRESGNERILVYEHAKTGEIFLILDPRLSLAGIEPVQQEVYRLLNATNATSGKMPQMNEEVTSAGWRVPGAE